jgi:cysteine-rich repeat protein
VTCTEDPGRSNLVGFGNNDSGNSGGACRQLDGVGQMECEDAYYVSQSNLAPVACWWDGDECRGSSSQYSALNACRHAIAECEGDQGRTNLLGGGNGRSHCRQLDGIGQMECENAFYVTGGGGGSHAVACTWAAGADWCLGTGLYDALNACDPDMSPPACSGDVGRTDLIGRGGRSNQDIGNNGGACGQFGDETDCVDAYYINDRDQAVACWWDGGGCRGSNRDNKLMNACFVAAASCSGRSTAIGFGHDNSGPCRNFDYSSEGECEDAFYEAADGGRAVACEWDAGSSHCYGCGYGPRPGGETTCTENVCAPITCDGAPGRGQVRACRDLRDQGACEDAWHTTGGGNNPLSGPTFAAACVWSDAGFCYGCGLPSQSGKECANSCAPSCGNGQLDGGEQCDDGNMFVGDCCDANCQFETEGSTCTDRLFCTEGAGTCQAGECVGAPERLCASCLADDCNELDNSCDAGFARRRGLGATAAATQGLRQRPNGGGMSMPEPEGTFCDDGVDGTANATCNAFGMCVAEPAFVPPAQAPALDRWGYALLLIALFGLSVRSLRRRRR